MGLTTELAKQFRQKDSCDRRFDDAFNRWNALTLKVHQQKSDSIYVNVGSGGALLDDLYGDDKTATRSELNSNLYVIVIINVRQFVFSYHKHEIYTDHLYLSNPRS